MILPGRCSKNQLKDKTMELGRSILTSTSTVQNIVSLPSEYLEICPEYAQYYVRSLKLLKSCYGMIFS